MNRVFICSRYRADTEAGILENIANARAACLACTKAGHAPFAPHLLYPQYLSDIDEQEREAGIQAGIKFLEVCDEVWVVTTNDGTISNGMLREIENARILGKKILYYKLHDGQLVYMDG